MRRGHELGLLAALAVASALLAFLSPQFLTTANWVQILAGNSILLMLAEGMTLVIISGGIDLSVGSALAVASTVAGAVAVRAGGNPVLVFAAALGIGLAMGGLNAFLISGLSIPPIVTTLATLGIYRGLLLEITEGNWITNLPPRFLAIAQRPLLGVPAVIVPGIAVAAGAHLLLTRLYAGRLLLQVGGHAESARRAGVSLGRVRYAVYMAMGAIAGCAGVFYGSQLGSVQGNAAVGLELSVVAAVVVGGTDIFGGRGSAIGTLLGVLLLGVIQNGLILARVPTYWQQVVTGAFLLAGIVSAAVERRREERRFAL
ncbi:MAG: ABC transporter permease [Acidobacteria bacterium]|nr:ABC transporter permease [Acidobacteriota bacterium]